LKDSGPAIRVSPVLTQVQQLQAELGLPLSNGAPGVENSEIILEGNARFAIYHPTKRRQQVSQRMGS
jgi:hypothetical protein